MLGAPLSAEALGILERAEGDASTVTLWQQSKGKFENSNPSFFFKRQS